MLRKQPIYVTSTDATKKNALPKGAVGNLTKF